MEKLVTHSPDRVLRAPRTLTVRVDGDPRRRTGDPVRETRPDRDYVQGHTDHDVPGSDYTRPYTPSWFPDPDRNESRTLVDPDRHR